MKHTLLMVIAVLLAACVMTPPLYGLLFTAYGEHLWPYARVFNRVVLLFFIIALYLSRSKLKLSLLSPYFYGIPVKQRVIDTFVGFCISICISVPLLFLIIKEGSALVWAQQDFSFYFWRFAKVVPAAFITSLIEESVFRVLLLSGFAVLFSPMVAVLLASGIYGWVHFIAPDKSWSLPSFWPQEGLVYFAHVIAQSFATELLPAIAGLMLVGVALCFTLWRSKAIYLGIGLHAGWIVVLKMSSVATSVAPGAEFVDGIGRRYFLVAEPVTWFSVIIVMGLIQWYCARRPQMGSAEQK
jgi:membrane protease YdiL (CAAX protease family)